MERAGAARREARSCCAIGSPQRRSPPARGWRRAGKKKGMCLITLVPLPP
ncbi:hypothetical protein OAO87_00820 [bacterium]|nr:hypothetical protein [bacterium]